VVGYDVGTADPIAPAARALARADGGRYTNDGLAPVVGETMVSAAMAEAADEDGGACAAPGAAPVAGAAADGAPTAPEKRQFSLSLYAAALTAPAACRLDRSIR